MSTSAEVIGAYPTTLKSIPEALVSVPIHKSLPEIGTNAIKFVASGDILRLIRYPYVHRLKSNLPFDAFLHFDKILGGNWSLPQDSQPYSGHNYSDLKARSDFH